MYINQTVASISNRFLTMRTPSVLDLNLGSLDSFLHDECESDWVAPHSPQNIFPYQHPRMPERPYSSIHQVVGIKNKLQLSITDLNATYIRTFIYTISYNLNCNPGRWLKLMSLLLFHRPEKKQKLDWDSETLRSKSKSIVCILWPWSYYLTSLSLSFLICKMGTWY